MPSKMTYAEFLAARADSVGASDIAKLHKPFRPSDIVELVESKVHADGTSSFTGNLSTRRGQYLESFVADEFARTLPTGYTLVEVEPTFRTIAGVPCHCSPDRIIVRDDMADCGGVEVKTALKPSKAGFFGAREAFEAGMVPDSYYAQVQWTMLVLDVPNWTIVADTGDSRLHIIKVPASPEFQRHLLKLAAAFWADVEDEREAEFASMAHGMDPERY